MRSAWGLAGMVFTLALLVMPAPFWGQASAQGRGNSPPVALISNPPDGSVFVVNETIYFDGRDSYDPDGSITDWKWVFSGYGEEFNRSQIGVNWSFNHAGPYVVALIVKDDGGGQSVSSMDVMIIDNSTPFASIAYPPDGSNVGIDRIVPFSSDGSSDAAGGKLTYRWDFGDGTCTTERDPVHIFQTRGAHQVQLWVRNETGAEGYHMIWLDVTDGTESGPLAIISSPANGTSFDISDEVRFWSNGSVDHDGYNMSFLWRFEELGPMFLYDGPNNETHRCKYPGSYFVTLLIFDSIGRLGVDRIRINVVDTNQPPVAVIAAPTSSELPAGFAVHLDANGSYDPDGDILTFDWWLNGTNGTPGSWHASGMDASLPLSERGNFELTLVVTDPGGKSAAARLQLTVRDMDRLLAWPLNGTRFETGTLVEFLGLEALQPIGYPPLTYSWSFGDGANAEGQAVQHAYSTAGNYTFTLKGRREYETFERSGWLRVEDGVSAFPVQILLNGLDGSHKVFKTGSRIDFRLNGSFWQSQAGVIDRWDLGDGNTSEAATVTHAYGRPGDYDVSLTEANGNKSFTLHRVVSVRSTIVIKIDNGLPGWVQFLLVSISVMAIAGVAFFLGGTEVGIFALFSFLAFLYTRIKQEEILDNYTRGQIKGYITANPGDHYNSIKQALALNNGTLAYHLKRLENEAIIKSRMDGMYKRFYPYEMRVPEPSGKALSEMQKLILSRVAETPGISQKDIAGFLRVSSGTINYHMEALIGMGRVVRKRDGMKVRYYLFETSFTDVGDAGA